MYISSQVIVTSQDICGYKICTYCMHCIHLKASIATAYVYVKVYFYIHHHESIYCMLYIIYLYTHHRHLPGLHTFFSSLKNPQTKLSLLQPRPRSWHLWWMELLARICPQEGSQGHGLGVVGRSFMVNSAWWIQFVDPNGWVKKPRSPTCGWYWGTKTST